MGWNDILKWWTNQNKYSLWSLYRKKSLKVLVLIYNVIAIKCCTPVSPRVVSTFLTSSSQNLANMCSVPSRFTSLLKLPPHYCSIFFLLGTIEWIVVLEKLDEIHPVGTIPLNNLPALVATRQIRPKLHRTVVCFYVWQHSFPDAFFLIQLWIHRLVCDENHGFELPSKFIHDRVLKSAWDTCTCRK